MFYKFSRKRLDNRILSKQLIFQYVWVIQIIRYPQFIRGNSFPLMLPGDEPCIMLYTLMFAGRSPNLLGLGQAHLFLPFHFMT